MAKPARKKKKKGRVIKKGKNTTIELPPTGADLPVRAKVQMAEFRSFELYMSNPGFSVEFIWKNYNIDPDDVDSIPLRNLIAYDTLKARAAQNNWLARRAEMWAGIERSVLESMTTDMTRIRTKDMATVRALMQTAQNYVTGVPDPHDTSKMLIDPIKPKSLEGLIGAMIKLFKLQDEQRQAIANDMKEAMRHQPDGAGVDGIPEAPDYMDGLTSADVAAMGEYLSRVRSGIPEEDEDEDDDYEDEEDDDTWDSI